MTELPCGEETMRCYAVSTESRTDGRTDRIAISISHLSVLTRDKKYKLA